MTIKKLLKPLITLAAALNAAAARTMVSLLALALLLALVAGCVAAPAELPTSDGEAALQGVAVPSDAAQAAAPANIYVEKKYNIDLAASRYAYAYADGRVYFSRTVEVRDASGAATAYRAEVRSVDEDGGDEQLHWSRETPAPQGEASGELQSLVFFDVTVSGELWLVIETTTFLSNGETLTYELIKTVGGAEVFSVNLSEAEDLAAYYIIGLTTDADGNAYVQTYDAATATIYAFDGATGAYSFRARDSVMTGVVRLNDGRVAYTTLSDSGAVGLVPLDFAAKSGGTPMLYGGNSRAAGLFGGFGEWSATFLADECLYGWDAESGAEAEIINFANSGIDTAAISGVVPMGDGEFLVARIPFADTSRAALYRLRHNPDAKVGEKTIVTLGVIDGSLKAFTELAVKEFNLQSKTTQVEIIDYGEFNSGSDRTLGETQLDMDILKGTAPDIFGLAYSAAGKYISKGVLEDLNPYLDGDASGNRDELFTNILDAGTVDGKLYHIMTRFEIYSLIGKSALFGNGGDMTMARINDVVAQYPDALLASGQSAAGWLMFCTSLMLDDLVDWERGTCDFTNAEFVELLKSAAMLPKTLEIAAPASGYEAVKDAYDAYAERCRANEVLLNVNIVTDLRAERTMTQLFGEEIAFLGFPSPNGGDSVIVPMCDYGINAASDKKDAAWEFISFLLFDSPPELYTNINRTYYESAAAMEMTPFAERDFTGGVALTLPTATTKGMWFVFAPNQVDAAEYADYHLTEDEIARAFAAIEGATRVLASDASIQRIIMEEAAAFLNGTQSAEETARVVQSRVSIYVAEQAG